MTSTTRSFQTGCLVCFRALLLFAPAATSLAQSATSSEAPGASSGVILQTVLSLALVISILFAAAWFVRRLNGGRGFGSTGPMKVVGGLMISPRERIVLIEVGDSWIVVGIVPGQIKALHTLPKGQLPPDSLPEKPFGQWLKQFSDRKNENEGA